MAIDEKLRWASMEGHSEVVKILSDSIERESKREELHGEVLKLRGAYKQALLSNLRDTTNFEYAGALLKDFEALYGETFEHYIQRQIVDIEDGFESELGYFEELKELLRNLKGE